MTTSRRDKYVTGLRNLWDTTYSKDRAQSLWGDNPVPFVADAIDSFVALNAHTVLDLGCGDGRNTLALAKVVPYVVGVDISRQALDRCQQRLVAERLTNCLLMEGSAYSLPFSDDQFDGAFCANLLGQIQHPADVVREVLRVTRPGASIVFNVLSTDDPSLDGRMATVDGIGLVYRDRYFYRYFDLQQLEELFVTVGVRPSKIAPARWTDPPHEGYREEVHEHRSWVSLIIKGKG